MNNFVYSLTALAVFLFAFYTWRIWSWKTDAGGWWNLATGKRAQPTSYEKGSTNTGGNVEAKISELASAFGIPPATLATAIASAVSAHAPPKTLSSIAKAESTASVVQSLVNGEEENKPGGAGVGSKLRAVAGFDDGGVDLD